MVQSPQTFFLQAGGLCVETTHVEGMCDAKKGHCQIGVAPALTVMYRKAQNPRVHEHAAQPHCSDTPT
jgi:hypothetical protein